jgi:hypothetical protein
MVILAATITLINTNENYDFSHIAQASSSHLISDKEVRRGEMTISTDTGEVRQTCPITKIVDPSPQVAV